VVRSSAGGLFSFISYLRSSPPPRRRQRGGAGEVRPGPPTRGPEPRSRATVSGRGDRRAQRPSSLTGVARDTSIPRVARPAAPVGWSARFALTIASNRQAGKTSATPSPEWASRRLLSLPLQLRD